ncbi:hypothetical protein KDA23_00985 [Candidatus Saccharibacteria bacterium]|nr:hypothetical protein [Candidatus Saccharibacteria bacterium]
MADRFWFTVTISQLAADSLEDARGKVYDALADLFPFDERPEVYIDDEGEEDA